MLETDVQKDFILLFQFKKKVFNITGACGITQRPFSHFHKQRTSWPVLTEQKITIYKVKITLGTLIPAELLATIPHSQL